MAVAPSTAAQPERAGAELLEVEELRVQIPTDDGIVKAVDGVSLSLTAGSTLGIVGESGSGKSVTAMTIMGLTGRTGASISGAVRLQGRDLLQMRERELRSLRGNAMSMIFQDPLASLHPLKRVGAQIVEAIQAHRSVSRAQARARAVELLGLVGIPDPQRRLDEYPHEFSGGMRQRAMIALALVNDPSLLIADEPTTALDVTVQAQILDLLMRLQQELGMAIVIITHDLGVVAEVADQIAVMYAGRIVERGSAGQIFHDPQHPYTWGLLGSIPRLEATERTALVPISGRPPSLITPPSGCHFHPRCPHRREECPVVDPPLVGIPEEPAHSSACVLEPPLRRSIWERRRAGELPDRVSPAPGTEDADSDSLSPAELAARFQEGETAERAERDDREPEAGGSHDPDAPRRPSAGGGLQ